jgi:flagellar transcriptional activator FlhC
MMATRRVYDDAQQVLLATELIRLGARLQLLESETSLSRERLIKLYKQQRGTSPPKGMLPFSTDWFISWQPNIHASVFLTIHQYLIAHADVSAIQAITKAYALYLEQLPPLPSEPAVLSLTRAWTLVRFFENRMPSLQRCQICHGQFVAHAFQPSHKARCGLCHLPARAGKRKQVPARIAPDAQHATETDVSTNSGSCW